MSRFNFSRVVEPSKYNNDYLNIYTYTHNDNRITSFGLLHTISISIHFNAGARVQHFTSNLIWRSRALFLDIKLSGTLSPLTDSFTATSGKKTENSVSRQKTFSYLAFVNRDTLHGPDSISLNISRKCPSLASLSA